MSNITKPTVDAVWQDLMSDLCKSCDVLDYCDEAGLECNAFKLLLDQTKAIDQEIKYWDNSQSRLDQEPNKFEGFILGLMKAKLITERLRKEIASTKR